MYTFAGFNAVTLILTTNADKSKKPILMIYVKQMGSTAESSLKRYQTTINKADSR